MFGPKQRSEGMFIRMEVDTEPKNTHEKRRPVKVIIGAMTIRLTHREAERLRDHLQSSPLDTGAFDRLFMGN